MSPAPGAAALSAQHGIRHPWADAPAPGEAVAVAADILWARLPLPMAGLDHVNVYALDEGDGWTLVDTGIGWARGRAALERLRGGPLGHGRIRRVILTHHHPDHVGLAGELAAEGAEIWASRVAWLMARMLTLDEQSVPTPEQVAFRRRAGVSAEELDRYGRERPFNFADCVAPLPLGFRALEDGAELEAAGRRWRVRLGEGHAPAHATLWSEDGLLLSGDQVLPGISPNIGVYPTEPEADPLGGWLESCHRFAALGADPLVLPGHRLPFRGLGARLRHLIDNHERALERILAALAESPKTAVEIMPALYHRPIGPAEFGLALVEAVAHLNHLVRRGDLIREEDATGALRHRPA
ncbi:MAG: MBL fold metallo-hydrolase [Paracoccaceae bacterium]